MRPHYQTLQKTTRKLIALVAVLALNSCGGGGKTDPAPTSFSVGGITTDLTGTISIANNGTNTRTITGNGAYSFSEKLRSEERRVGKEC